MSGNSIGFVEEIKKLCQKMCSVRMLIWSAEVYTQGFRLKKKEVLVFETGGCVRQNGSHEESYQENLLHFFGSAISNHLSFVMAMPPYLVALIDIDDLFNQLGSRSGPPQVVWVDLESKLFANSLSFH